MNDQAQATPPEEPKQKTFVTQFVFWLGLALVFVGLLNVTPGIPGWDALWQSMTGNEFFRIRRFETEWLYPIVFFLMMLIVALQHSLWRSWADKSSLRRYAGLALDVALIVAAASLSLTYIIEIEAICLLDVISGDRERMIAEFEKIKAGF